jgi:hypothetical protein
MAKKRLVFEQCEAVFKGSRCEQNKNDHIRSFGYLKHNSAKQGFWTDAAAKEETSGNDKT